MDPAQSSILAQRPARTAFDSRALQLGAGLVLLVTVFYWPTLNNGFVIDDGQYVQNNPQLRSAEGLYNIWFKLGATPQYYPLVFTTFWVEYHIWEVSPFGYHATNMLLHAVCAVLVWRLLVRLAVPGSWLVAAIFAVHPVHVESVAWVTERKNVLSCALALGSLLAYLRYQPFEEPTTAGSVPGRGRWGSYALALVLYLGALWSKTATVSVPAVLLVIYWWKRGRVTIRDVANLIPFFALGLLMSLVTVRMETTHVGASGADFDLSFVERTLVAGRALWFYAAKLVWPYPLVFFYPRWAIDAGAWWQYFFPFGAATVVVGLWLARSRIGRGPLAAVLIFGGVLLPALGYFNVYWFKFSFVADHFQYHASIALLALLTATAVLAFERWTPPDSSLRVLAGGGAVLVLAAVAFQRTHAFRDLMTLCVDTLDHNPTSWAARYNLGDALIADGKVAEGIREIQEAVRLSPDQYWLRSGLGSVLFNAGKIQEAEAQFRRVLEAEQFERARVDAHVRLGAVLAATDRVDEAVDHFRQALELDPSSYRAHYNYGLALTNKGEAAAGLKEVRRAIEIQPFDPEIQHGLGVILSGQGKTAEAIEHLQAAVDLFPGNALFRVDLASALFLAGELEAAQQHLVQAVRANPHSAEAHNLLGSVLVKRRNFNAAIREFETALKIEPAMETAKVNLQRAREARSNR